MNDRAEGVWSFGSAFWYVVKNVLIFGVFGPPIGALTWMLPMTIYAIATASSSATPGGMFLTVIFVIVGMISSYIFGLLPAMLAGAIVGLGEVLARSFGFFHAVVAGLVVAFLLFWCGDLLTLMRSKKAQPNLLEQIDGASLNSVGLAILSFGGICVVPTLICWWISRLLLSSETSQASSC